MLAGSNRRCSLHALPLGCCSYRHGLLFYSSSAIAARPLLHIVSTIISISNVFFHHDMVAVRLAFRIHSTAIAVR